MASSSMTSSSSSAAGRAGGVASAGCRRASTAVEFQAPLEVGKARTSARLFACNRIECPGRSKPAALKKGSSLTQRLACVSWMAAVWIDQVSEKVLR